MQRATMNALIQHLHHAPQKNKQEFIMFPVLCPSVNSLKQLWQMSSQNMRRCTSVRWVYYKQDARVRRFSC